MNENFIIHHTYQLKDERAYRVAIKYLPHSTDAKEVAEELASQGHKFRYIVNEKQRQTKEPLNIFFVDLEPAENNEDIYKITKLFNRLNHQEKKKKHQPMHEMPTIWAH
jgi:hypothetical protein